MKLNALKPTGVQALPRSSPWVRGAPTPGQGLRSESTQPAGSVPQPEGADLTVIQTGNGFNGFGEIEVAIIAHAGI